MIEERTAARRTNGRQPDQPAATTFNRPPRVRPRLPAGALRLPALPSAGRQGRAATVFASLLTSGALIAAAVFVNRVSGGVLLYLIPMVAGAAAFLLVSIGQLVHDYWRRWQAARTYAAELRAMTLRLIQLYTDQQLISYTLNPELCAEAAAARAAACDAEQHALVARFLPTGRLQRLLRRAPTPAQLGLQPFSTRAERSPAYAALLEIAGNDPQVGRVGSPHARLWERRPADPDFLTLSLGIGAQPAAFRVETPPGAEPPLAVAQLVQRLTTIQQVPQTLSLPEAGSLGLAGPRRLSINLAHALLWQAAVCHAPPELRIAAIYGPAQQTDWAWLRWLPHTLPLNGDRRRRLIAVRDDQVEELLIALLDELSRRRDRGETEQRSPQIVLLIDDERVPQRAVFRELIRRGPSCGINCMVLAGDWEQLPGDCGAMLRLAADGTAALAVSGDAWSAPFAPLQAEPEQSERLSRALMPLVLSEMGGNREIPRSVRLLDLLRTRCDGEFDPTRLWKRPLADAWHADVPIGRGEGGEPVYLDLRQFCDGPHGIIAGKTGAGKSELLQALITALAATHTPDRAQFMLIDFKGGAALRDFAELPHTVGLVTDLLDSRLAERAITALRSEIRRRKDLLAAYNAKDIGDYRALRPTPPPLANLLIVIDEFDTMVKEQPGFVSELITVVKQGRSLGVHLLVASQEPSTAVKDEIKRQLQYWIALRLGSLHDSREMLDRPDAFFLPADLPGRAYKRVGAQVLPFQAPLVSAPFQALGTDDQEDIVERDPVTGAALLQPAFRQVVSNQDGRPLSDLRFMIDQIKRAGSSYAARPIWRPPLPARLTLTQEVVPGNSVLPAEIIQQVQQHRWWNGRPGRLVVPIGLLDLPQESRQEVATVDLSSGHLLVIGAPGSGKTMLLRTLLTVLALTHSPADVWCYLVDAGGQGLGALRSMPHIGGLVQVREVDAVRRVIWMLRRTLEVREQSRRDITAPERPPVAEPAIVLVIDKFALFREEHEHNGLIDELVALATQGRAYGIHLVLSADRAADVPYKLQSLCDTRLLLRQSDANDALALTGRRSAGQIPLDLPGRGYQLFGEQGWIELQVALPYVAANSTADNAAAVDNLLDAEISAGLRNWMQAARQAWDLLPQAATAGPPPVRLLPTQVDFATVWQQVAPGTPAAGLELLVGLEAQALGPAQLTLKETTPAALVVGGFQSGKTTALRTMLRSVALRHSPAEINLVLVDPRRSSFRDLMLGQHQPQYITGEAQLAALAAQLDQALEAAQPGPCWLVCIDDFDIGMSQYTTQFQKPFTGEKTFMVVLEKLVSLGRERGFALLIAANTSSPTGLLGQLSAARHGLILQPHTFPPATHLLGVRLPIAATGSQHTVGRGLLVGNHVQQWVQVASAA